MSYSDLMLSIIAISAIWLVIGASTWHCEFEAHREVVIAWLKAINQTLKDRK